MSMGEEMVGVSCVLRCSDRTVFRGEFWVLGFEDGHGIQRMFILRGFWLGDGEPSSLVTASCE